MSKFRRFAAYAAVAAMAISSMAVTGCDEKQESSSQAADELAPTEAATEAVAVEYPDIQSFSDEPNGMLGRAKALRAINDDIIGYIKIPGTNVDYPVTQYDGEDLDTQGNAYYMDTDIYGNYLESGTIFMDYRDVFVPDKSKQSQNLVLYGHNMLNGSKFATLHYYRQDDSFYEESPIIEFSSNYENTKYVIFAYFVTSGSYGESSYGEEFAYWDMENMNEEEFNKYVEVCNERSYISPGIDVKYGDQLLTLQTCHLDEDNSRFLVIGRRLRDDETPEDFMNKTADAESGDAGVSEEETEE
ncbi:MAG: class B sortase [Porcipelethomonas sp.]